VERGIFKLPDGLKSLGILYTLDPDSSDLEGSQLAFKDK